ncbi:MAG TPA: hypothetical protein VFZ77_14140 [Acidimicrobiales bacterium]
MGSLRDHVDLAGGLRSGLSDEPPWWARGAIGAFAAVVALVIVLSAVLGVGGGQPAGPPGAAVAPGAGLAGGPAGGAGPATAPGPAASDPALDAGGPGATGTSGGTGGAAATGPVDPRSSAGAGEAPDDTAGPTAGTVALADRDGTFRQVPRAAVDVARRHGAGLLDLPAGEVRHHLVAADGARVEFAVSSLDGDREVHVVVTLVDGAWRVT